MNTEPVLMGLNLGEMNDHRQEEDQLLMLKMMNLLKMKALGQVVLQYQEILKSSFPEDNQIEVQR